MRLKVGRRDLHGNSSGELVDSTEEPVEFRNAESVEAGDGGGGLYPYDHGSWYIVSAVVSSALGGRCNL